MYSKPQEVFSFSEGCTHFHGHLRSVSWWGCGFSFPLLRVHTLPPLCRSLGCTWSLTWLCQTNSHTFVSSLAVSDSIGCESATRIMEGREQCILQSCLSRITLCFFSTPDVFIFAPFVKYLGNCLQLPSYMAFNCEI